MVIYYIYGINYIIVNTPFVPFYFYFYHFSDYVVDDFWKVLLLLFIYLFYYYFLLLRKWTWKVDMRKEPEIIKTRWGNGNHVKPKYGLRIGKLTWGEFAFIFTQLTRLEKTLWIYLDIAYFAKNWKIKIENTVTK